VRRRRVSFVLPAASVTAIRTGKRTRERGGASMQIYSQLGRYAAEHPVQLRKEGIVHYQSTTGAGACGS
jgi:hypothetical protein